MHTEIGKSSGCADAPPSLAVEISSNALLVGVFLKPIGIKGQIKLHPHTSSADFFLEHNAFCVQNSLTLFQEIVLEKQKINDKGDILTFIKGFDNRNLVEPFRLKKIFISKSCLPKLEEDEYYMSDLASLIVVDLQKRRIGRVLSAQDFGAGVFLDITLDNKKSATIQFNKTCVLEVNLKEKFVQIDETKLLIS